MRKSFGYEDVKTQLLSIGIDILEVYFDIFEREVEQGVNLFRNEIRKLTQKHCQNKAFDEVNELVHKFTNQLLHWNDKQKKVKSGGSYKLRSRLISDIQRAKVNHCKILN